MVMLDRGCAFSSLPPGPQQLVGAYLAMPKRLLAAWPMIEIGLRIGRAETAARAAHGWIMDCFLLARNGARQVVTEGASRRYRAYTDNARSLRHR